jgi:hypothetical protein
MQRAFGARQPGFYLIAPLLAAQTPFAEVLTVVGQQPIAVFAYSRARPADHLPMIEVRWRIGSDPGRVAAGETSETNLFHRPSVQAVCESRVMHDLATTDIDSVMQVTTTRCDNV